MDRQHQYFNRNRVIEDDTFSLVYDLEELDKVKRFLSDLAKESSVRKDTILNQVIELDEGIAVVEHIVRERHVNELKKIECSSQLSQINDVLLHIMVLDIKEIADCFCDQLLRLSELLEDIYEHQLQSLDFMHSKTTVSELTGLIGAENQVLWPCTVRSINLCGLIVDNLEFYYGKIKHTPLEPAVEHVIDEFGDLLEDLHDKRYDVMEYTIREAERLFHLSAA